MSDLPDPWYRHQYSWYKLQPCQSFAWWGWYSGWEEKRVHRDGGVEEEKENKVNRGGEGEEKEEGEKEEGERAEVE